MVVTTGPGCPVVLITRLARGSIVVVMLGGPAKMLKRGAGATTEKTRGSATAVVTTGGDVILAAHRATDFALGGDEDRDIRELVSDPTRLPCDRVTGRSALPRGMRLAT